MHGLLLIDKPSGMTSHDVVQQVRRLYRTRKVGHAGTLDPLATGVLPVAVGAGTKILQFLLAEDKSYRATFRLGITTDTLDAEGQMLLERPVLPEITFSRLKRVCADFCGTTDQIPPMYSALKKDGIPLYKLARQGKIIEREPRRVTINRLQILHTDNNDVTIEVDCSKGTYIRSLIGDIGEQLGCGAHLIALRRLCSAGFSIEECHGLDELHDLTEPLSALLSLDDALRAYPAVQLSESAIAALRFGIPPELNQVHAETELQGGSLVRLQDEYKLVAMARYAPLRSSEKRGDFELIRVHIGR